MRLSAFPALLAAAALAFAAPAAVPQSTTTTPPPKSGPPSTSEAAWRSLLDRTPWPAIYEDLFRVPFDPLAFWFYPLDRPLADHPADYYGPNQYGQIYALHVRESRDLGELGGFHFWYAQVGMETPYALLETQGSVIQEGDRYLYLPAHFFEHDESDIDVGRDCTPPTVSPEDCDPLPCDMGGLKYLDQACVEVAGARFKVACKAAWSKYDADSEAAKARWNNCVDVAFGVSFACYATGCASGFWTFGIGPLIAALACTAILDAQLAGCDREFDAASTLAKSLREVSLTAAQDTFNIDASLCCKDCPPIQKQNDKKPKPRPNS